MALQNDAQLPEIHYLEIVTRNELRANGDIYKCGKHYWFTEPHSEACCAICLYSWNRWYSIGKLALIAKELAWETTSCEKMLDYLTGSLFYRDYFFSRKFASMDAVLSGPCKMVARSIDLQEKYKIIRELQYLAFNTSANERSDYQSNYTLRSDLIMKNLSLLITTRLLLRAEAVANLAALRDI